MREAIIKILTEIIGPDASVQMSVPDHPSHGDYSTSVAFALARATKRVPSDVARELVCRLEQSPLFEKVEMAGEGFINFWISQKALMRELALVLEKPEVWGMSAAEEDFRTKEAREVAVVDYFGPNVAKIPHIGHLRSAVIGDALKRLFLARGYRVVADTHIGDWGTQFGILLHGYKQLPPGEQEAIRRDPIAGLNALYVAESARIEADPERRDRAKEEFAMLERGDAENRALWEWMVAASREKFAEIGSALGLLPFEEDLGESFYEDRMPPIVEQALRSGAATNKEGAVVIDLEADGLGDAVLTKSDGASTYLLRDLATLAYRWERWHFLQNVYVVDVRQSRHFRQLFASAQRLGFGGVGESVHVEFGFMSLPEGALSTRKGTVVALEDVLSLVIRRAREVIEEKNPELADKERVAAVVGVGALKYFDLSHHRASNIVFDRDKSLSFEGNTGPYLQYTHARMRSILRRIPNHIRRPAGRATDEPEIQVPKLDGIERRLLAVILRFPEAVEDALAAYAPNALATYLHGLARTANEFYHANPVLQETDEEKRTFRLGLVEAAAATLKNGLDLLGIEAPEEM